MTAPEASTITVATCNYEHGGRRADGSVHLAPAVDHIAEQAPGLDLQCLQCLREANLDTGWIRA